MATRRSAWMAGAVAAAAAALALAPAAVAMVLHGKGDTGVVTVSSEKGNSEGEEPMGVNPRNPDELTVVANVFQPNVPPPLNPFVGGGGLQDTRVYSSRDGGRHWRTFKLDQGGLGPLKPPVPSLAGLAVEFSDAFNIVNTDADTVWDRHGNAYYESGDIHGLHHDGDEVETVWRSTDGGLSWKPHLGYTAVSAREERNELDRPWLATDNTAGPRDGRLYTTFETTPFANIPPEVYAKYSDDHAKTWSRTVRVDAGTYETQWNPRAKPAVGADGALFVVYDRAPATATPFAPYDGPIVLALARSLDGGKTFKRFVVDRDVRRVQSPDEATPQYTEMIPAIATDPQRHGRIAIAWPQARGPDSSRILMRYSRDGGEHWSRRIDVADDGPSKTNQHDHVTLAWLRDGRLFVGWRDRRCCGGSFEDRYQQWVRVFRRPRTEKLRSGRPEKLRAGRVVQFSDGPQLPNGAGRGALEPDEFQGLVATSRGVSLTWSQLRGELSHLMYRRIPLAAFASGP